MWRVSTDEEVAERHAQWQRDQEIEDARKGLITACGTHDWLMTLDHPEDDMYVGLHCTRCPIELADVLLDAHDMVFLSIDDVEVVVEGKHNLSYAATVPVTLVVLSHHSSTPNGEEWDVELVIEATGPIVPLDPEEESNE